MMKSDTRNDASGFRFAGTRDGRIRRPYVPGNSAVGTLRSAGLTLVELLLAMTMFALLVQIGYTSYQSYLDRTKVAHAKADIKAIETAIADYEIDNQALPDDLSQIGMGGLLDPWGNPYQYLNIATAKGKGKVRKDRALVPINSDYDLYSMGKDGNSVSPLTAKQSQDDIVRGRNGQFVGLASDF